MDEIDVGGYETRRVKWGVMNAFFKWRQVFMGWFFSPIICFFCCLEGQNGRANMSSLWGLFTHFFSQKIPYNSIIYHTHTQKMTVYANDLEDEFGESWVFVVWYVTQKKNLNLKQLSPLITNHTRAGAALGLTPDKTSSTSLKFVSLFQILPRCILEMKAFWKAEIRRLLKVRQ